MSADLEASYEELPYPPLSHFHTRIDRLQSIAYLHGIEASPVGSCRVLELGCGPGTNLLGMASRYPQARFLGIDLSPRHIRIAQEAANALGLRNLEFRQQSLTDFGPEEGEFDYILAHGVYSWVPLEVQQKLMQVCGDHLSPSGVAYVSYNTYPGWFQKQWLRDALAFAADGAGEGSRLGKARAFVELLCKSPTIPGPVRASFEHAVQDLAGRDDSYIVHEFLDDSNLPLYFRDFAAAAAECGLQYLADAEENFLIQEEWAAAVISTSVEEDIVGREQRSDFLRARTFRKSLLCRENLALNRGELLQRLTQMRVVSYLKLDPQPGSDVPSGMSRYLRMDGKGALLVGPSAAKTLLDELQRPFPGAIRVAELMESLKAVAHPAGEAGFAKQILQLWKQGYFDLLLDDTPYPKQRSERPAIHPLARFQSMHSQGLTNRIHGTVNVVDAFRLLVPRIDGTRTDRELAQLALDEGIIPSDPRLAPTARLDRATALTRSFLDWCFQNALMED